MSNLISIPGGDEEMLPSEHMGPHEHDQSAGDEFLDSGLRMHEQPFDLDERTP